MKNEPESTIAGGGTAGRPETDRPSAPKGSNQATYFDDLFFDQLLRSDDHKGMRVSASGLLRNLELEGGDRFMVDELSKHLKELGQRFYDGDIRVVDQFLQLYALDDNRPKKGV